jgi:hypothetical protein
MPAKSLFFLTAMGLLAFSENPAANAATIFSASETPAVLTDPDSRPVELGVKFQVAQAGSVSAIRFYKGPKNTGSHTGTLWDPRGLKVSQVAFSAETASGWQQANLPSPVSVSAGITYTASYHAPKGHYSVSENAFINSRTNGYLTVPASAGSQGAGGNGVYAYSPWVVYPTQSYRASNYWVDVVFTPDSATSAAKTQQVSLAWNPSPDSGVSYRVKVGTQSGNYTNALDAGQSLDFTVTGLARNVKHYFAVTSVSPDGAESLPSNEVSF